MAPLLVMGGVSVYQTREAATAFELAKAERLGQANADLIEAWMRARRDEIRYLAQLDGFASMDIEAVNDHLRELSQHNGHYDTIFLVSPAGIGVAGVERDPAAETTVVLTPGEAAAFQVSDRDWFRRAMAGEHVISEVLISRATGRRVATVASPVYENGAIVGVVRGAVLMDTVLQRVSGLSLQDGMEAYLVDAEGKAVTPAASVRDPDAPVATAAVDALRRKHSGKGLYDNAAGTPVLGTYQYIPMLDWGLVIEMDQRTALGAASEFVRRLRSYLTAGGIATFVLAFSFAAVTSGRFAQPIVRTGEALQRMAAGDLAIEKLDAAAGDELDEMAGALNRLVGTWRDTLGQVHTATDELATKSQELARAANQANAATSQIAETIAEVAAGAGNQSRYVEETVRTINALKTAIDQIAAGAQEQARAVQNTVAVVDESTGACRTFAAPPKSCPNPVNIPPWWLAKAANGWRRRWRGWKISGRRCSTPPPKWRNWAAARSELEKSYKSFPTSPSRPTCWPSTRPSRRPGPASTAKASRWWPTKSGGWRNARHGIPRRSPS